MKLDLALLADAATVDGSGKLNILGIFDHIAAQEFPARHERMCLVLRFIAAGAEAGTREVQVAVRDPEGDEMARMTGSIGLAPVRGAEGVKIPQVLHMDGFVFPQPGVYSVEVEIDGAVARRLPLRLSRAPRIPEA
jgi:hypothetical protein